MIIIHSSQILHPISGASKKSVHFSRLLGTKVMLPNSHERLELEGHVKIWRKWCVGDSHGVPSGYSKSLLKQRQKNSCTSSPSAFLAVKTMRYKEYICFERHSFIQFASWTSEPLKTEVRHHASAPHSKSVLNLSVWDENSGTLHQLAWIEFHSRISWTLGVAAAGIRMRCDPSCRCCSCCVQMMWNPSHQDSLSDWSDSDSDASSYESVEEWPGVPSKKTGGKKGLEIGKAQKRSKEKQV